MQTLFLLLALALGGADVYRWVDAAGQVHYSDLPYPGADRITIDAAPFSSPPAANGASPAQASGDDNPAATVAYESLTIQSPGQDETLWNIEGQLDVEAAVQPALQEGHTLQFYLDGRAVPAPETGSTRTQLSGVFRGEHTVRAQILDASGTTLVQSPTVTFFVQQSAIANKKATTQPLPRPRP